MRQTRMLARLGKSNPYPGYTKYYVRKTGNDTTGDGSISNPWLTINKAKNTVPIGGKCLVLIGDGVYVEGTRLVINRSFLDWVVFRPELGSAGTVKITGTGTYGLFELSACSNARFDYITIGDNGTDIDLGQALIDTNLTNGATMTNVYFYKCSIIGRPAASIFTYGMYIYHAGGTRTISNITLDGCNFSQTAVGNNVLFPLKISAGSVKISGVTIKNCTMNVLTGSYQAAQLVNIDNLIISNCNFVTNGMCGVHILGCSFTAIGGVYQGATYGMLIGEDGLSTYTTTGLVSGSLSKATTNHGMCVGGCDGVQILGVTVQGTDNGLVIKEATNTIVTGGTFTTVGGSAAILCKAAIGSVITNTTINLSASRGMATTIGSPSGTKCRNITFTHNIINCTGTSGAFSWDGSADDGGCVVDYNTYNISGGSQKYGGVLSDPHVTTLSELKTAWAGYGDGTNDSHSTAI